MSLEVLLIPIGIAAIAAIRESRSTDLCEKCKATRIKDQRLLEEALAQLGATNMSAAEGRVTATTQYGGVTFQRVGDGFLGRVDGKKEQLTATMLSELDATVGRIAQSRSVTRIRERASELGLTLITERAEDGTVQLVFEQA